MNGVNRLNHNHLLASHALFIIFLFINSRVYLSDNLDFQKTFFVRATKYRGGNIEYDAAQTKQRIGLRKTLSPDRTDFLYHHSNGSYYVI